MIENNIKVTPSFEIEGDECMKCYCGNQFHISIFPAWQKLNCLRAIVESLADQISAIGYTMRKASERESYK